MTFLRWIWLAWIGLSLVLISCKTPFSHWFPSLIPEWIDSSLPPLQAPTTSHFLGTDELGRDVLIRLLFGTGYSLLFCSIVAILTSLLGLVIGISTSLAFSSLRRFLILAIDTLSALPFLPLSLIGLSLYPNQIIILGFLKIALGWGSLAQLVRMESELLLGRPMIQAVQSQGLSMGRILTKHLFPLLIPVAIGYFPVLLFSSLLTLATLDFFGLGFPIPTPNLAEMFRQFHEHPEAWWLFVFPLFILSGLLFGLQKCLIDQNQSKGYLIDHGT